MNDIINSIEKLNDLELAAFKETLENRLHPLTFKKLNFNDAAFIELEKDFKNESRNLELAEEQIYFANNLIQSIIEYCQELHDDQKISKKAIHKILELEESSSFEGE